MLTSAAAVRISKMGRFRDRVNMLVVKCATSVMIEDAEVANHAERVAFAAKVFSSAYDLTQYVNAVLTDGNVLAAANAIDDDNGLDDDTLVGVVDGFYNAFAGVYN